MLIHLIVCVVLGAVVSAVTNIGFLFWVVAIAAFICGLPFALITSFVHNEVSYAQDRADDRAAMAEIAAEERAEWHEMEADARMERYIEASKNYRRTYIDNRQVHIHRIVP